MLHACLLHPPSFLDELQQVVPHVLKDKVKFVVLPDDLLELDQAILLLLVLKVVLAFCTLHWCLSTSANT